MPALSRILPVFIAAYLGVAVFGELTLVRLLQQNDRSVDRHQYDGHDFLNATQMSIYIQEGRRDSFYPWAHYLDEWMAIGLLAVVGGFLGGSAKDFRSRIVRGIWDKRRQDVLGSVIAVCLIVASLADSTLLTEGTLPFKPASVFAVCFLGGLFSEQAWPFLKRAGDKVFRKEDKG